MSEPSRTQHFPGVEGLRGVAVCGVVLGHVHLYSAPDGRPHDLGVLDWVPRTSGTAGVVLFFTLSGFLLYRPFADAVVAGADLPGVRDYLCRRFLRVFPAYWFALLVAGLVLRATYVPALQVTGASLASEPSTLAVNLLLLQGFHPTTLLTGIGPAWTLAVELGFYLLLPLLAGLAAALARCSGAGRRAPWATALTPSVLLVVLGQLGWLLVSKLPQTAGGTWGGSWHAVVARSFLAHAGLFAAGMALAVLHVHVSRGSVVLPRTWRSPTVAAALVVSAPALVGLSRSTLSENIVTLVLSVAAACVVALVVLGDGVPARVLCLAPVRAVGVVSYGLFLWNEPVVWLLRRHHWTALGPAGFTRSLLLTFAITGAFAALSWFAVERPSMRLGRRTGGGQAPAAGGGPGPEVTARGRIRRADRPAPDRRGHRPADPRPTEAAPLP